MVMLGVPRRIVAAGAVVALLVLTPAAASGGDPFVSKVTYEAGRVWTVAGPFVVGTPFESPALGLSGLPTEDGTLDLGGAKWDACGSPDHAANGGDPLRDLPCGTDHDWSIEIDDTLNPSVGASLCRATRSGSFLLVGCSWFCDEVSGHRANGFGSGLWVKVELHPPSPPGPGSPCEQPDPIYPGATTGTITLRID